VAKASVANSHIVFLDYSTLGLDHELIKGASYFTHTPEELVGERIKHAHIIVTNKVKISAKSIEQAPHLKKIVVAATGIDHVDSVAATSRNIPVLNVKGYSTQSVAELAMGMILSLNHRIHEHSMWVRQGEWSKSEIFTYLGFPYRELAHKTLGILGTGEIAQAMLERARPFFKKILNYSSSGRNLAGTHSVGLDELLTQSQVVSLHSALNEKTRHIINAQNLSLMNEGAILVNTSRGALIDEAALVETLNKKKIFVGLDVVDGEPMRVNSPLQKILDLPNVIITPHIAWSAQNARETLIQTVMSHINH
jgi:lactate dehydrogenase-like 2-hydroxyacid dehydrogenase